MNILIIQTAFLGDVILATAVAEKLHLHFPEAAIDFLLRKGNEGLLEHHPFIREVIVLDKKKNKISNLIKKAFYIRKKKYSHIINLHRFGSSGFITLLSGAKERAGFDKNPFSFCYTRSVKHTIGNGKHETERNQELIAHLTDGSPAKPGLYPGDKEDLAVLPYKKGKYYCIAPASVWFTKRLPAEKWAQLLAELDPSIPVYLLGAKDDHELCANILRTTNYELRTIHNLAGKHSFLETASLMKDAVMNYVNDSAPLHIASAVNAPVTVFFCSTVPEFGFGPLSDKSYVFQTNEKLSCRPCGLHGYKSCPEGHFKCALSINMNLIKR